MDGNIMIFKYKGRNKKQEVIKGFIEGNSRKEVILKLKRDNITLITLKTVKSKENVFQQFKNKVFYTINNINFSNIFNRKNKNAENDVNEILSKYQALSNKSKSTTDISDEELEKEIQELLNMPTKPIEKSEDKKSKDFNIKDIFTQDIKILKDNMKVIKKGKNRKKTSFLKIVRKKEVMLFAKQLNILLDTGVPLTKSLQVICEQTKNQYFKKILTMITAKIIKGNSLSDALSDFPKVFDNYFVTMVRTGEETGELSYLLNLLYEYMFEKQKLKKKIINALIYPCFVLIVLIIGLIIFAVKIVPQFKTLFVDMELPLITRIVFGFLTFIGKNIIVIFITIILLIVLYRILCFNNYFVYKRDSLFLKIPVFGTMILNYQVVNIINTLNICLSSGITLPNSLNIVIENTSNSFLKYKLDTIRNGVIQGVSMSNNLSSMDIFPVLFKQMIRIGEESGKLNITLEKAKQYYSWELESFVNNIDKWFEPITIIIIAVFVTLFVLAVFLPILDISSGTAMDME